MGGRWATVHREMSVPNGFGTLKERSRAVGGAQKHPHAPLSAEPLAIPRCQFSPLAMLHME